MAAPVTYDDGPVRATWIVTDGDARSRVFRIKDAAGDYVTDPEGDGWEFFGQVREQRGGDVVGDITFTFNGAYITQTLPDEASASSTTVTYWWEKESRGTSSSARTGSSASTDRRVAVASNFSASSTYTQHYAGSVAGVAVYGTALTSTRVVAHYRAVAG